MATNFAEAFFSARNAAQDRTRQREADAMQRQQFDLQMQGTQQKQQASQQQALYGLAKGYKDYLGQNPQGGAAYYENFLRPSLAGLGLGDSGPYNEAEAVQLADQVLAAYMPQATQTALAPRVVGNALVDSTGKVLYQAEPEQEYQWSDRAGAWIPKPMAPSPQRQGIPAPYTAEDGSSMAATQYAGAGGQPVTIGDDLPADLREQLLRNPEGIASAGAVPQWQRQPGGLQAIPVAGVGPKQDEQYTTLSAQEVQALGLPQGTVAQRSPTGQVQIVNKPRDLPSNGQVIDNGDGTTTFIPAGKTTEGERNAAGFYQRMVNSRNELAALEAAGYKPDNLQDRFGAALDDTPLIGGILAPLGRAATSTEGQQYQQAAMNWIRANLRKESGAAIGVKEANDEYRNYFPVLGDTPEVIAQKARNRLVVEQAMRSAAGGALAPPANSNPQESGVARPTTDAEYNALPSGSLFIDPDDGKQYRKP